MTLNELLGTDNPFMDFLEAQCKQRAAVMALVKSILDNDNEELTIRNVKICIANMFSRMIDDNNMVGDDIEKDVMESLLDFAKQEHLLEQFQ